MADYATAKHGYAAAQPRAAMQRICADGVGVGVHCVGIGVLRVGEAMRGIAQPGNVWPRLGAAVTLTGMSMHDRGRALPSLSIGRVRPCTAEVEPRSAQQGLNLARRGIDVARLSIGNARQSEAQARRSQSTHRHRRGKAGHRSIGME